jgi:phage terminase small subunit
MSTPLKTTENMHKHLTKAEREARQGAEASLQRGKRAYLKAPEWLTPEAKKVFEDTRRRLHGLKLLDTADVDLLAMYSDAIARYQSAVKEIGASIGGSQIAQAWSRVALSYADKLGLSPTARARLARKKAERQPQDELALLLDEATEIVNSDDGR